MNWVLLHKYLSDECSPEEKERLEKWRKADRDNEKFFESIQEIWRVEPRDNINIEAKEAWKYFNRKLNDNEQSVYRSQKNIPALNTIQSNSYKQKGFSRSLLVSAAAAVVGVALIFIYLFLPTSFTGTEKGEETQVREVSTGLAQRTSFRLADGSRVFLNADSRVKIAPQFGDSLRSVYLEGEAYFDVESNPQTPFVVRTKGSYTKVLGTKFGVKAYPEDRETQVVVEEGEVMLGASEELAEGAQKLTGNTLGLVASDGKTKVTALGATTKYLAWKDGRLIFDSTPFEKVIPQLERWYNIKIEAEDAIISQKVTASFDDEPMLEVLNVLAASLDAHLTRDSTKISFNSKP